MRHGRRAGGALWRRNRHFVLQFASLPRPDGAVLSRNGGAERWGDTVALDA
jgi:hypothetical protein